MRWPRRELNLARLAQRKDRALGESGDGPCTYMQRVHSFHSILANAQADGRNLVESARRNGGSTDIVCRLNTRFVLLYLFFAPLLSVFQVAHNVGVSCRQVVPLSFVSSSLRNDFMVSSSGFVAHPVCNGRWFNLSLYAWIPLPGHENAPNRANLLMSLCPCACFSRAV